MRKYSKKPSGYFWRIRKQARAMQAEGRALNLHGLAPKAQAYVIMIAFSDLPLIKIN